MIECGWRSVPTRSLSVPLCSSGGSAFTVRLLCVCALLAVVGNPVAAFSQQVEPKAKDQPQTQPKSSSDQVAEALPLTPGASAGEPRPFVKISPDKRGLGTLAVKAGEPVKVVLDLPGGERWDTANIGQFHVRTYGRQESIDPVLAGGAKHLAYTFAQPGWALIVISAGPAGERGKSDSWQRTPYCTKMIVRVDPPDGGGGPTSGSFPNPGLTSKVGMKVELLPYISPPALRVSSDPSQKTHLPVRVYWEGASEKQATIWAYGPDGAKTSAVTGGKGIANIEITKPGRWLVRYEKNVDGTMYTGDLIFDAPGVAPGKGEGR